METKRKKHIHKKWWSWISVVLLLVTITALGGCSNNEDATKADMGFTTEEYTQRLKEAVKGTNDSNVTFTDENIIINSEEEKLETDQLATYMFTDNTGILYKENEMDLVISDLDAALIGDDSTYNLVRIFIGTVDSSLSIGDRQKMLQSLEFNTQPMNTNENKFIKSVKTNNYKFTYMYNGETKARVIKAEVLD